MVKIGGNALGVFFITSVFEVERAEINVTPNRAANEELEDKAVQYSISYQVLGRHEIEVENLTTLPYHIEINSYSSDANKGYLFYNENYTGANWTASFEFVIVHSSRQSCLMLRKSLTNGTARIRTTELRYKRPIWIEWEDYIINPHIELAIECH